MLIMLQYPTKIKKIQIIAGILQKYGIHREGTRKRNNTVFKFKGNNSSSRSQIMRKNNPYR